MTAANQPQPGDIWERDGERREVVLIIVTYKGVFGGEWLHESDWREWQSGAKLIERREPTQ